MNRDTNDFIYPRASVQGLGDWPECLFFEIRPRRQEPPKYFDRQKINDGTPTTGSVETRTDAFTAGIVSTTSADTRGMRTQEGTGIGGIFPPVVQNMRGSSSHVQQQKRAAKNAHTCSKKTTPAGRAREPGRQARALDDDA